MRFGMRSMPLGATGLTVFLATTTFAQSRDPFQSDPGPAPPAAEAPRPHPVSRPVPRVAPEREAPPSAPAMMSLPSAPNPATRFDGIWVGTFDCGATARLSTFEVQRTAVVKDGRIEIVSGAAAGAPGSWSVAGTLTPDGSVSLSGESVSAGRPGTPPAGQHVMHHFSGRVVGEQFTADDLDHSGRGCKLTMTRRR